MSELRRFTPSRPSQHPQASERGGVILQSPLEQHPLAQGYAHIVKNKTFSVLAAERLVHPALTGLREF